MAIATIATPNVTIGQQNGSPLYIQNLSIWSSTLASADIANWMAGSDPTGSANCVANFQFVQNLGNSVTGNNVTPTGSATVNYITEVPLPVTASASMDTAAAGTARPPMTPRSPVALRTKDILALAAKLGIDTAASPPTPHEGDPMADVLAWYDTLLQGVPPRSAAKLRAMFARNLSIGAQLQQKGVRAGTYDTTTEGTDLVIRYYYTEAGPQEVGRIDAAGLDDWTRWAIRIIVDEVSVIATAFGVFTVPTRISAVVQAIKDVWVPAGEAAAAVPTGAQRVVNAVIAVAGLLWQMNALFSVFYRLVTASWWSLVFAVLSLVAQIAATLASGGWLLAFKLSQLAVSLGQFGYDLAHEPARTATVLV